MNNEFFDEGTGITFEIPAERQLTRFEAETFARRYIAAEKKNLFTAWKRKRANEHWAGDETVKADELFSSRHPGGGRILIVFRIREEGEEPDPE